MTEIFKKLFKEDYERMLSELNKEKAAKVKALAEKNKEKAAKKKAEAKIRELQKQIEELRASKVA